MLTKLDRHGPTQIATLHGELGHIRATLTNILDFMIGSDELDVDGVTPDGERVPVLRNLAWQL